MSCGKAAIGEASDDLGLEGGAVVARDVWGGGGVALDVGDDLAGVHHTGFDVVDVEGAGSGGWGHKGKCCRVAVGVGVALAVGQSRW